MALGTLLLGLKTRSVLTAAFWKEVFRQARGCKGLFMALVRESWRYVKPEFHPSLKESRTLLLSALAELERLGVDRPRLESRPSSGLLPRKFGRKIMRTIERFHDLQSRHPFFFSRIDDYEGAWVHSDGVRKINFCTYSYLGLLRHHRIDDAAKRAIERYGTGHARCPVARR